VSHPALAEVPDALLVRCRNEGDERARARKLIHWLERRGVRVSLLDIEHERRRRTQPPQTAEASQPGSPDWKHHRRRNEKS